MSEKVRKGWKWASEYLKKHCLQKGWRHGRKMNASGAKKHPFLQKFALLRPKRALGAFYRSGRKKSENRSWAIFGSKNVPRCLCFTLFGARDEKDDFCQKVVVRRRKNIKKLFLAQHKNMKSCEKWKKWFSLTFARSAKPFINVTFWARFFDQNRKNANFPLLGAKMWKWAHFPLLGRFWRPKRSRTQKLAQKWKKRFWAFWAPKTCPEPYVFHCFALGAKMMLFRLLRFSALFRFLGAKAVLASKSGKTAHNAKNGHGPEMLL